MAVDISFRLRLRLPEPFLVSAALPALEKPGDLKNFEGRLSQILPTLPGF